MAFVQRYSSDLAAFRDLIGSVCKLRMSRREINPALVRDAITDPAWLQAALPFFYRLEVSTWAEVEEWMRVTFGWTPEAWAAANTLDVEVNWNASWQGRAIYVRPA